ncbi:hypothetical protein EVAR_66713_1 [Eumeta japonica]|uniref:Uncharacterized protein n=1 Tax=Eumeta variegata TaxID=151549 RepID=A0A4C1ZSW2_EUMVA|nr:hypothetical protein EVAR_66713_1 [Eumeta japonica]
MKRFITTKRKIDRDIELRNKYKEQMKALVNKGYAKKQSLHRTENRTWYLPHSPVINGMKPRKIRVVHNAAVKTKGVSLNDHQDRPRLTAIITGGHNALPSASSSHLGQHIRNIYADKNKTRRPRCTLDTYGATTKEEMKNLPSTEGRHLFLERRHHR